MIGERKRFRKSWIVALALLLVGIGAVGACRSGGSSTAVAGGSDANAVILERGLTPADVLAAVKTYVPTGRYDEYVIFSSGGHSGQMLVIGVPSMRLLKVVGVFTPEPWQGWGFSSETRAVLAAGDVEGRGITWADTHHPALSETDAEYDGRWVFINDKAHARVAVVDLRDFETKQIVNNPIALSDHGGAFVTPGTEYVIEGGQYAAPLGAKYASMGEYETVYRGMVTLWAFDRASGRIDPSRSFALEMPPYWQDLCDAGKGASEGWLFCNSFNTEMAKGGIEAGNPPFEAGASQRDMDYLHVIDWRKAAALAAEGRTTKVNGFDVLSLETLTAEGVLYFIPEPKSPHGVDVTPGGEYLVISGKLDPHVTVYSFAKIADAVGHGTFSGEDAYGVPILDFDAVVEVQIELGLGPLHTQFDHQGYAYTSLFLDTAVARWSLGGDYDELNPDAPWTLVQKIPVHYNVGHIVAAEGDTASPDGGHLVSLNKWAVDRFTGVGPLHPQNFQLIDIGSPGASMQLLYDMPIGLGEPHYAQMIKADKLDPWDIYPEVGWDPITQAPHRNRVLAGEERVVRDGNRVEIFMTAVRSHFTPERIEIRQGDHVTWHVTNIESAKDATHGLAIPAFNINLSLEPGESTTVEFVADRDGVYSYYCSEFCSALHLEMLGYMLVEPAS
jgi:nitrous-oxide reductase